jgi:hypothetical protein
VVTPPIGACCSGSRHPSSSVNGVVSMAGTLPPRSGAGYRLTGPDAGGYG